MASSHKPVRASPASAPGLLAFGGVFTQPDNSQAAARTLIINFTYWLLELGAAAANAPNNLG
jgi:hypothetical protein